MDGVTVRVGSRHDHRRVPLAFCVVTIVASLAAGCSTSPSASRQVAHLPGHIAVSGHRLTVGESDSDMVAFARCLRARGVDEPDPFQRPGHSGLTIEMPPDTPEDRAALSACDHFLAPILEEKEAGGSSELAAWLPHFVAYARCMRAHDIPMLDPNAQGSLNLGNVPGISSGFGRYSPEFRTADSACRHLLPAAIHDDGTGP